MTNPPYRTIAYIDGLSLYRGLKDAEFFNDMVQTVISPAAQEQPHA